MFLQKILLQTQYIFSFKHTEPPPHTSIHTPARHQSQYPNSTHPSSLNLQHCQSTHPSIISHLLNQQTKPNQTNTNRHLPFHHIPFYITTSHHTTNPSHAITLQHTFYIHPYQPASQPASHYSIFSKQFKCQFITIHTQYLFTCPLKKTLHFLIKYNTISITIGPHTQQTS